MSYLVDIVLEILGTYVPLNGEGLASINFPWVVNAIILLMCFWFVLRIILNLVNRNGGRR